MKYSMCFSACSLMLSPYRCDFIPVRNLTISVTYHIIFHLQNIHKPPFTPHYSANEFIQQWSIMSTSCARY